MFTSRRFDTESALYYYRARYYAYDIGRFLQTDPIGYDDGLNMYSYCGNNPINWADPYGLCGEDRELVDPDVVGISISVAYINPVLKLIPYIEEIGSAMGGVQIIHRRGHGWETYVLYTTGRDSQGLNIGVSVQPDFGWSKKENAEWSGTFETASGTGWYLTGSQFDSPDYDGFTVGIGAGLPGGFNVAKEHYVKTNLWEKYIFPRFGTFDDWWKLAHGR